MAEEPEVTSFDVEVEKAWTEFRDTLAGRLEKLDDDQNIILELDVPHPDGGAAPYVQFVGFGGEGLRSEVSSNAYLAPDYRMSTSAEQFLVDIGFDRDRDEAGEPQGNFYVMASRDGSAMLAGDVVLALCEVFDVIHPTMLREVAASDLSQAVLPDPGDIEPLDLDAAYAIENSWELMLLVHRTIYAVRGDVVDRDDDGDWPLVGFAHVPLYVSVRDDEPVVRVWTRVVGDITEADVALREVNILNRDAAGVRFHVKYDALWVQYDLHSAPFVPRHLQVAVGLTAKAVVKAAADFALRTGGSL
ncbi:MAG: hypothetical protein LC679_04950 [Intrasporangiaceae bacterium]|nr:hypothetical protein [Intrasporangiaceae bacterium]